MSKERIKELLGQLREELRKTDIDDELAANAPEDTVADEVQYTVNNQDDIAEVAVDGPVLSAEVNWIDADDVTVELLLDNRPVDNESLLQADSEELSSSIHLGLVLDASFSMLLHNPPAFEPMLTAARNAVVEGLAQGQGLAQALSNHRLVPDRIGPAAQQTGADQGVGIGIGQAEPSPPRVFDAYQLPREQIPEWGLFDVDFVRIDPEMASPQAPVLILLQPQPAHPCALEKKLCDYEE